MSTDPKMNQRRDSSFRYSSYFRFSPRYALISLCLLVVLVLIALFVNDSFIRPTLGDVLVVVWLYYVMSSVINLPSKVIAVVTVAIAFAVEIAQYLNVPELLGLSPGSLFSVILGSTFDWLDLIAYAVGGMLCLLLGMRVENRDDC